MTSEELQNRLLSIQDNSQYAILSAQQEFEQSQIKIHDPRIINEELSYQKEIFSKLKFIYLEQETRDKFLRKISELTSVEDIGKVDVQSVEAQSLVKKAELKGLKTKLGDQLTRLEQLTSESHELYQNYESRLSDANELLHNMKNLEDEIDKALREEESTLTSQDYYEIFDNIVPSQSTGNIEQVVASKQDELSTTLGELDTLQAAVDKKAKLVETQEQQSAKATAALLQLRSRFDDANGVETVNLPSDTDLSEDKFQKYCQWYKEMNDILIKFTNVSQLKLKPLGSDKVNLSVSFPQDKVTVIYSEDFKILSTNKDFDATEFNQQHLDHDSFTKELVALVICLEGEPQRSSDS